MPTLLNREGERAADQWSEPLGIDDWTSESDAPLLLTAADELSEQHANAAAIAIEFPAFNDGRGLSTAVLLRTRWNYKGELRAVGDVQPDIVHYMVRCGFDSFLLADDADADTAARLIAPYSANYQASVTDPEPHFRRTG